MKLKKIRVVKYYINGRYCTYESLEETCFADQYLNVVKKCVKDYKLLILKMRIGKLSVEKIDTDVKHCLNFMKNKRLFMFFTYRNITYRCNIEFKTTYKIMNKPKWYHRKIITLHTNAHYSIKSLLLFMSFRKSTYTDIETIAVARSTIG